ncbi:30S ribosomal protein S20 [Candidatus Gottesmanbacteria bacterium]|nr:30S ribosomal protein S20 [Candidatus Gottesmanbacteria bacterium]
MPIIKQAHKKMRHDRKRSIITMHIRRHLADAVKSARKSPTKQHLAKTFRLLDKAAKKNIIHKNKASRLKSRLSRLLAKK